MDAFPLESEHKSVEAKCRKDKNPHRFQNISEKVAVLPQHLQQLQHLGLSLAVLVTRVRVHDVVQGPGRPGSHLPGWPGVVRVCGVHVQELDQEGDAPAAPHHVAVGGGAGHGQQGPGHLVHVSAAQERHQGVGGLRDPALSSQGAVSVPPGLRSLSLTLHAVHARGEADHTGGLLPRHPHGAAHTAVAGGAAVGQSLVQGESLVVELLQVAWLRLTSPSPGPPSSHGRSNTGLAGLHPLSQPGELTVDAGDGLDSGSSPG